MVTCCDYDIEKTRDGNEIVKVYKDGKEVYIGSKYNYQKEIEKFINLIGNEIQKSDVIFIFGFATGKHIFELAKKYTENKIIVFEPNKKIINYAKNKIEKSNYINNIQLLNCEKDKLISYLHKYINEYNYKNSKYACFCNYGKVFKDEYNMYYKILQDYIIELALDVNTKLFFYKTWFDNLINIIPHVINGISADLYNGKLKNKPAIIISAGPSLSKNIEQIKKINNNAFIIVSGRTLGSAINEKIKPDLLVIADSKERNYEFVKEYLKNEKIPLLFYEGGNIRVIEEYKGPKIFFSYNQLIYKIIGKKMKKIYTGGSVAHAMTSYAANLGCNPIIFIGQDFAYTNDKVHSELAETKDGIDEKTRFEYEKKDDDVFVKDINGQNVRTSILLNDHRKAMERIIKLYPHVKFINASEGGAFIEGTEIMPLRIAAKKYCNKPFEKIQVLKSNNINYSVNAKMELEKLISLGHKLKEIVINDNNFNQLSEIINVFEKNSVYNLLLYNDIYEYLNTANHDDEMSKKNKLYENVEKSLDYANEVVCNILCKLKSDA